MRKIPNTFSRVEGGLKDHEILFSRVIDRSVRPLFQKGFSFETQLNAQVLGSDGVFVPDVFCINSASASLAISNVPWAGPIGAVRVGIVDGDIVINPTAKDLQRSRLNLVYAATEDRVVMAEASASEVSNEECAASMHLAHEYCKKLIKLQKELVKAVGLNKRFVEHTSISVDLIDKIREKATDRLLNVFANTSLFKQERGVQRSMIYDDVCKSIRDHYGQEKFIPDARLNRAFNVVERDIVSDLAKVGKRVDGRGLTDIRPLYGEVGTISNVHGSSLFQRGETQTLSLVTIGSNEESQRLVQLVGPDSKSFMVHYSFPPFSVNEVRRQGGRNRREVGHGNLAEKGIYAVYPDEETFPYSVRLNTETLMSNGSSSMAAATGGSLALMHAGVPLKRHVAGLSMGLIMKEGSEVDYTLLTDINGFEDHHGDMDFKIIGTRKGITALQLDVKPQGIPLSIITEALALSQEARAKIIDMQEAIINEPCALAGDIPQVLKIKVKMDRVGKIIGPGGSVIKQIQMETNAKVKIVDNSNIVYVSCVDPEGLEKARRMIEEIGNPVEIEVGKTYDAKVTSIKDYGAFIELPSGEQTLLHISELAQNKVEKVQDVLKVGTIVQVTIFGKNDKGFKASMKKRSFPQQIASTVPLREAQPVTEATS